MHLGNHRDNDSPDLNSHLSLDASSPEINSTKLNSNNSHFATPIWPVVNRPVLIENGFGEPNPPSHFNSTPINLKIYGHYKLIGESLNRAENRFLLAGVPLIFNTKQNSNSKHLTYQEINDLEKNVFSFMRYRLSPVPTKSIELYLEDIYPGSHNSLKTDYKLLNLEKFPLSFRILYIAIIALAFLFTGKTISLFLFPENPSFILNILFLSCGILTSLFFSSEYFRRYSFSYLLEKELNRRTGKGGKKVLGVCLKDI